MDYKVRKEILKELPVGAVVIYHGPSVPLQRRTLTKIHDRSRHMGVTDGNSYFKIRYFNLTCDHIRKAQAVIDRLNYDPDALPF